MGFLVGFLFLTATWLTFLTKKNREHALKNKVLELRNEELRALVIKIKNKLYEQETKRRQAEKTTGNDAGRQQPPTST